ncbi:MAG: 4Fe-4S dicluster domain-containing protein [Promethearchaeia archaeon]
MTEEATERREPISRRPARVDPEFKHEVLREPGGESLKLCFQCGTCTAGCIIAEHSKEYQGPRKIIRMAQLGLVEELLSSPELWYCSTCYSCTEVCPQGVAAKDIIRVLQNIAVKRGYVAKGYQKIAESILKTGWAQKVSRFKLKKREKQGLPQLPDTDLDEVEKLMKTTGLDEIAGAEEAEEEE